ncbi:stage III sporulation protein AA [Priestia endophytica]|jgi:stage III sporulation protein AA|uniref:Stage III sporulation protein AA n=2 Tax=Priestia endophytica TaxID=135735 RepID=A0AAX1QEV7_9BACI|nr:stage III sporulation protein AA [Priestia endophytica]KYG36033.1 stage III sporulation protein AA [Priestia endophytica]MBG9814976.1 stage III sporulation protein AA [Priestia endophytica]RAS79233.1 stage III sporulation protein AA [Priestia endophytica]RAS83907.1 stage III sporulation protein AA [Priestia endophytica]RAS88688.1 stage III sporulation protein AA [Priestia endophytica]
MESVLSVLPQHIVELLRRYIDEDVQEIRLRINRPIELIRKDEPIFYSVLPVKEDFAYMLSQLSQSSMYMLEEELQKGYITIKGGHRVGLAGRVITENGKVKAIRDITSLNIRIAREKIGIGESLIDSLYDRKWLNTVIIGAPQSGKTTMLRDLARLVSTGVERKRIPSQKVGIVDERSEIAGCLDGVPQHTFGPRVDVLDACPKAEGMMMLIRSMSPNVLIVDEVGRVEDTEAILEAVHAGVSLILTAHGSSVKDMATRPSLKALIDACIIDRFVLLSNRNGPGTVEGIFQREVKRMKDGIEGVRK